MESPFGAVRLWLWRQLELGDLNVLGPMEVIERHSGFGFRAIRGENTEMVTLRHEWEVRR